MRLYTVNSPFLELKHVSLDFSFCVSAILLPISILNSVISKPCYPKQSGSPLSQMYDLSSRTGEIIVLIEWKQDTILQTYTDIISLKNKK